MAESNTVKGTVSTILLSVRRSRIGVCLAGVWDAFFEKSRRGDVLDTNAAVDGVERDVCEGMSPLDDEDDSQFDRDIRFVEALTTSRDMMDRARSSTEFGTLAIDALFQVLHTAGSRSHDSDYSFLSPTLRFFLELCETHKQFPSAMIVDGLYFSHTAPFATGGFADVFKGTHNARPVAIKKSRYAIKLTDEWLRTRPDIRWEALVWIFLRHKCILPLIGVTIHVLDDIPHICLISPIMEQGTIDEYIEKTGRQPRILSRLLLEIAESMKYLHDRGLVHGDIHRGNILIDNHDHVRLTDFGSTAIIGTKTNSSSKFQPPGQEKNDYGQITESDVWQFAFVCLEISTEQSLVHPGKQMKFHNGSGYRPTCPGNIPNDVWLVIERCWSLEHSERPSMHDIIAVLDPWVHSPDDEMDAVQNA